MAELLATEPVAGTETDDLSGKYLSFFLADTVYGVELLHVKEIISIQPITYVPYLPSYIKGITNLRGGIVPVIDSRLRLGQPEKEYDEKTCIIILDIGGSLIGMIVDSVSEVVTVENSELSEPPQFGERNQDFLDSIVEIDGRVILMLNCERFLQ